MIDQVRLLMRQIDEYLNGYIDAEALEQATMGLISHDDFDTLDTAIQDFIYTLDSKELNQLQRGDIEKIRDDLRRLLNESK